MASVMDGNSKNENFGNLNSLDCILDEIDYIFDSGKFSENNHVLRALINLIFCKYFDKLLSNTKNYKKAIQLFLRTRDQWGIKESKDNSRAQLYWIRSMIKGFKDSGNPVHMLNQWFQVSKKVAIQSKTNEECFPNIVQYFITHPNSLIRIKTLQYIQLFIIIPEDKNKGEKKTNWEFEFVKKLSDSVIKALKMYYEGNTAINMWFELEAMRFLTWMVVNYNATGLCPAKLCYDLWQNEISSSFFSRLSDTILIYPVEGEERETIASTFQIAGRLLRELERDNPQVEDIFKGLTEFCLKNCAISKEKDQIKEHTMRDELRLEFISFFQSISKFLSYKRIDHFNNINTLEELSVHRESKYFKSSIKMFNEFYELSQYIKQYYYEKYEDIYTLGKLNYETFYKIRNSINRIENIIKHLKQDKQEKKSLWLEIKLFTFILNQWENFIKDEVDNYLIFDFAKAIMEYNAQCIEENTSMDIPLIFRNIFTRLNIMAECDESYLFFQKSEGNETVVIYNNGKREEILKEEDIESHRIPSSWLDHHIFLSLAENDIKRQFKGQRSRHMLLRTPGHELTATIAVYVFFWNKSDSKGFSRLESREILGEFLTTTAYLQSAWREQSERQEEFFRIVSHELGQVIRGLLVWISILQTGKLEDKPEMRKEYYNRFQYSLLSADHQLIRSLLSFRENARFDLKACNLDKAIEETVKLAKIQYKDYGNVQLDFIKSPGNYEIVTDTALVSTAVMNLLTNALKYNPNNKPVELSLFTEDHHIIIEVKDQGVGIPRSKYEIVFKKFARGSYPREYQIDGLGIGLAASKKNIELLGGNITFRSQEGKGSTFRITLSKKKFHKSHMIVTQQPVKNPPDLSRIKDIYLRQKINDKLDYEPHKKMLILRGVLTEEQYLALSKCYKKDKEKDKNTIVFNRKALDKLHRKSKDTLNKMQIEQK